jgi:hypothetical protein
MSTPRLVGKATTAPAWAAIALVFLMHPVDAQGPSRWTIGGAGYGSLAVGERPTAHGMYGYLGVAGLVAGGVALGGESAVLSDLETTHVSLTGLTLLYPSFQLGLFAKVALGIAYVTAPSSFSQGSAVGLDVTVGVGYDINLGDRVAIVGLAQVGVGGFGDNVVTTRRLGVGVRSR